jgi:hypothetical protein
MKKYQHKENYNYFEIFVKIQQEILIFAKEQIAAA